MPFARPDLGQIENAIRADMDRLIPGAEARARHSVLSALARAEAGAVHGLYGYLDHLSRQVFPDTAETEHLERWARVWGMSRKQATRATGKVILSGEEGAIIPAGTELQTQTGVVFVVKQEIAISDGQTILDLEAQSAGSEGNLASGMRLELVSPIAGVESQAIAQGNFTGGTDQESDTSLRERLLRRIRRPPQGGASQDYLDWTLAIPGVTRAWVYPQEIGIGTVTVRFMMDDQYENGIPQSEDVGRVQSALDIVRPVTAEVFVVAPIPVLLNITNLTISPDTPQVRLAIEAEIADLIAREAVPGGTILISHIREAISLAAGEADHRLTRPNTNITHEVGEIAVPGRYPWST